MTCRHCLSGDIPDAATHCRHCGRKLRPTNWAKVIATVLLLTMIIGLLWIFASVAITHQKYQDARDDAGRIIRSVSTWCNSQTTDELRDVMEKETEAELAKLELSPDDARLFDVVLSNQIEAHGCGPSAQLERLNAEQLRREQVVRNARLQYARLEKEAAGAEAARQTELDKEEKEAAVENEKRERKAYVFFASPTCRADVTVNGEVIGKLPFTLPMDPGDHTILIECPDYKPWVESIHLEPKQSLNVTPSLAPASSK